MIQLYSVKRENISLGKVTLLIFLKFILRS